MSGSGQDKIVEQVIRPTGLLDPQVEVRPVEGQIDDLMEEIRARAAAERAGAGHHPHQENGGGPDGVSSGTPASGCGICTPMWQTIERMEIIRDLRLGEFDVLVGINLLREGLDLPEVSLVAMLDADKEGFLRSETSLIQTIGRAARNAEGLVILYADTDHPLHAGGHGRDGAPPEDPGRLQQGPRHRAQDHHQGRPGDLGDFQERGRAAAKPRASPRS